jgi:glucose-1-phosphate thymidylyltransferase
MKGVVLAGGTGSRLHPLTKSINKHCLPVYDRPMIYYPIQSLVDAGIDDIVVVAGGNHMSQFIDLLGDGSDLNCNISYVTQMKPGGIAEAIALVEPWVEGQPFCVILGDNIFVEDISDFVYSFGVRVHGRNTFVNDINKISLCSVMCIKVPGRDAVHYGVLSHRSGPGGDEEQAELNGQLYITEKPEFPAKEPDRLFKAVTGLYAYTPDVFNKIKELKPSARGELEVSDLNDMYAASGDLVYSVTSEPWFDCGVDISHMLEVANRMKELSCE